MFKTHTNIILIGLFFVAHPVKGSRRDNSYIGRRTEFSAKEVFSGFGTSATPLSKPGVNIFSSSSRNSTGARPRSDWAHSTAQNSKSHGCVSIPLITHLIKVKRCAPCKRIQLYRIVIIVFFSVLFIMLRLAFTFFVFIAITE